MPPCIVTSSGDMDSSTSSGGSLYIQFPASIEVCEPPSGALVGDAANDEDTLKEWVWKECQDEIMAAMKVTRIKPRLNRTQHRLALLDEIGNVQRRYLRKEPPKAVFGALLTALLQLMDSEYGFIGEVKRDEATGTPYLQTHALTNIAWNAATQKFYEDNVDSGLKFTNLNTLFGHVIVHKEPVISNRPQDHPSAAGIPEGHPPLNYFLGIPFFSESGGEMNGMVGIANKPGGYSEADVHFLEPFLLTCSNLIQAYSAIRENQYLIDTLEEKVAERTMELKCANERLEVANRKVVQASAAQLEHFACMSHEIRTPLNCIVGISSLLIETDLDQMQQESLRMMITSGELLKTVVDDVLDYSKLVSGKVEINIQRTNLQDTLDAVVHSISMKALERCIKVKTYYDPRVPQFVDSDSRRMQQILFNLLGNAVKFSKERGTVELHVELIEEGGDGVLVDESENGLSVHTEETLSSSTTSLDISKCPFHPLMVQQEQTRGEDPTSSDETNPASSPLGGGGGCQRGGSFLRIVVKDYGKGIEKENFESIFLPFSQEFASETEQVYGGTGLGLAISSKLTKQLGGSLAVDSEVGKWAKFTLQFPLGGETSSHADKIRDCMSNTELILVTSGTKHDVFSPETIELYGLNIVELKSCDGLKHIQPKNGTFHVCLIKEDLFDLSAFKTFGMRVSQSCLLTFGPHYSVPQCRVHFRCPLQVLPSVMMHKIVTLVETVGLKGSLPTSSEKKRECDYEKLRILLAEDNVVNQKVLSRVLSRIGIKQVCIVGDGQQAVDESKANQYDVIFMDMQMPVMGGVEATRIITSRKVEEIIPRVIFVTANVSESFEREAKEAGASGFISKPFKLQGIKDCLDDVLNKENRENNLESNEYWNWGA